MMGISTSIDISKRYGPVSQTAVDDARGEIRENINLHPNNLIQHAMFRGFIWINRETHTCIFQ
jgi:hypothetical protein